MVCIYIAILSKALYSCLTFAHSFTDGGANTSGAGRVRWCLAQAHLDTYLGRAGDRTSNLPKKRVIVLLCSELKLRSVCAFCEALPCHGRGTTGVRCLSQRGLSFSDIYNCSGLIIFWLCSLRFMLSMVFFCTFRCTSALFISLDKWSSWSLNLGHHNTHTQGQYCIKDKKNKVAVGCTNGGWRVPPPPS